MAAEFPEMIFYSDIVRTNASENKNEYFLFGGLTLPEQGDMLAARSDALLTESPERGFFVCIVGYCRGIVAS
jgi:hypothetical protein